MLDLAPAALRRRREAIIDAHVAAENRHDVEATLATFARPRYEVVPLGEPLDGAENVRALLGEFMAAFPDFRADIAVLHHSETVVAAEIRMTGTQRGPWAGMPASGHRIDLPAMCVFEFDVDRLVCERVYFDMATLLRQIGAGREA